jgi:23S rRNA pseudouridine2605 synthase
MGNQKLAVDLVHGRGRLFTVGRLDKETSGLILITNDGAFADAVSHPRNGILKEYLVKTEEEIGPQHLERLGAGMVIDGAEVRPINVKKVRKGTLKIVLGEGKKHEVRHLVKNAGLTLYSLTRVRIGSIHLGKMPPGDFRPLSAAEREELAGRLRLVN